MLSVRRLNVWGRELSTLLGNQGPRNVPRLVILTLTTFALGLACQSEVTPTAPASTSTGVPGDAVPVATTAPATPTISSRPNSRLVVANLKGSSLSIVDASGQQLLETIDLAAAPRDVVVTVDGRYALYPSAAIGSNQLVIFDLLGRQKVGEIRVGTEPWSITLDPTDKLAFVTNSDSNTLSVVDIARRTEIASVPVGRQPRELVYVMRSGGLVYTANFDDDSVSVVDATTRQAIGKVPVGREPVSVATTPNGRSVFVANSGENTVSVIDVTEQAVTTTIPLAGAPTDLAVSPSGQLLLVTVQTKPSGAASNQPENGRADQSGFWLGTRKLETQTDTGGEVVVVDPDTFQEVGSIAVAPAPESVIFSADGTTAFVANASSNSVAVIDVKERDVIANVDVGQQPVAIALAEGPTPPGIAGSQLGASATPTPATNAQGPDGG